jgi:hypothetical protein
MAKRGPTNWGFSKPRPYDPMFFCFKLKWKPCDDIWFISTPIGRNQLLFIMDEFTMVFSELKECPTRHVEGLVSLAWMMF